MWLLWFRLAVQSSMCAVHIFRRNIRISIDRNSIEIFCARHFSMPKTRFVWTFLPLSTIDNNPCVHETYAIGIHLKLCWIFCTATPSLCESLNTWMATRVWNRPFPLDMLFVHQFYQIIDFFAIFCMKLTVYFGDFSNSDKCDEAWHHIGCVWSHEFLWP